MSHTAMDLGTQTLLVPRRCQQSPAVTQNAMSLLPASCDASTGTVQVFLCPWALPWWAACRQPCPEHPQGKAVGSGAGGGDRSHHRDGPEAANSLRPAPAPPRRIPHASVVPSPLRQPHAPALQGGVGFILPQAFGARGQPS